MELHTTTIATPAGPFSCALDAVGAVVATAFGDVSVLRTRLPAFDPLPGGPAGGGVRDQVLEYFAGVRRSFDLKLAPVGTEFQHRVWAALRAIPSGETRSYRDVAVAIGNPAAVRAVGRANATNPLCLLVPCHRVIGADGSLTGFAFGEGIKRWLLDHERMMAAQARAA
jgi:methylated-DNA-[protein]-cysteine S-methyltransferase